MIEDDKREEEKRKTEKGGEGGFSRRVIVLKSRAYHRGRDMMMQRRGCALLQLLRGPDVVLRTFFILGGAFNFSSLS